MPRDSVKAHNQSSKQVRSWILASALIVAMGGVVLPAIGADLFTSAPIAPIAPVAVSLNPLTFDAPAAAIQDLEAAAKVTKNENSNVPDSMGTVEFSEWQWTITAPKTIRTITKTAKAAGKTSNNPALGQILQSSTKFK